MDNFEPTDYIASLPPVRAPPTPRLLRSASIIPALPLNTRGTASPRLAPPLSPSILQLLQQRLPPFAPLPQVPAVSFEEGSHLRAEWDRVALDDTSTISAVDETRYFSPTSLLLSSLALSDANPPWRQPRGKWVVYLVIPHTNPPRRGGICGRFI